MKRSENRILTTHVGSLPRPKDLIELYQQDAPDGTLLPRLKSAVAEIVKQQVAAGIDVVDDGEFGKAMRRSMDYGAWWSYIYNRLAGYEVSQAQAARGLPGMDVRKQRARGVRRVLRRRRRDGNRGTN
jgi:5-methyltetrahydropteroyltriglutamate--homocysteine methyltransferase